MISHRWLSSLVGILSIFTIQGLQKRRPNVLFLVVDDLRPQFGCFEVNATSPVYTPNLDRLATRSLLFQRAYVQQAVCSPSRTSLLTGRRPDTTRVHDLTQYWRHAGGNFTTLPQYFKENGYATAGLGKIFHPGRASGNNDPPSWTEDYFTPDEKYWQAHNRHSWLAANEAELQQHPLPDMQIADAAVKTLTRLAADKDTPFFLAVGFLKPHLPFLFPSKFLDLYPPDNVSLPTNPFVPVDLPEIAWSNFDELRKYDDILDRFGHGSFNATLPKRVVLELRRAYYASVSYVDHLLGIVLNTASRLGLDNTTIISVLSDHGYQLGEHAEWCKHTNFEISTRAPLMLSVPGLPTSQVRTDALVELVDVFPTIVEAAGLPGVDLCPQNSSLVRLCVEGVSLLRLASDPRQRWKRAAFSQYPRMLVSGDVLMGYSMRTDGYRLTEWVFYDTLEFRPLWEKKREYVELYDHQTDPDENVNVADCDRYKDEVERLRKELRDGWRKALPPPVE